MGGGFQRPGLKTGVKNDIFWSEIGSGFGESAGTPPARIPQTTPRGPRPGYRNTSNLLYKSTRRVVTSECVIEPSEKGTQTSAIKAQKKARRLGRVGAREEHENAILSTELKTILNQRKKIEDN